MKTVSVEERKLSDLWSRLDRGESSPQDRIDAVTLAGKLKDSASVSHVRALTGDEDEEVRYYALQALVLDLSVTEPEVVDLCWRLLQADPAETVRAMAAACLGSIFFGTRRLDIFERLLGILRDATSPSFVKRAVYNALFQISGKQPREWPELRRPRGPFRESQIDWGRVAELEDSIRKR